MGQSKGILCLRCAKRHDQPLFVALLCAEIPFISVILTSALLSPRRP